MTRKFIYPKDEILIESVRDGLVDEIHSGFIVLGSKNNFSEIKGNSGNYPFYLRSCAKPLQAALMIDYGMDKYYNMTEEEIAVCAASHAGEKIHTDTIQGLLTKIGLDETYLKCGLHEPLSKTRQKELIMDRKPQNSPIYNNCSGKHTMMLGLCKMNNWHLENYYEKTHPLQKSITKKIYELCQVKEKYPVTTDGCGVPIVSMPLKNILIGYLNLFCDIKYKKITDAFLNQPYLIGGENRTDTKIISQCSNIVAKVGAGGLCSVVNVKTEEGFIVKISGADMKAREICVLNMINDLGWANIEIDNSIKTLHGQTVGYFRKFSGC